MREFIVIVGGLSVTEEDLLDQRETLVEDAAPANGKTVWISPDGERVLLESNDSEAHLQVQSDDEEFAALWEGDLAPKAAERLAQMISESADYGVYYLNNMTFMLKRQALAAANSLARHP